MKNTPFLPLMKTSYHVIRILFGLLLLMPVAGGLGFLPQPTADMYSTPESWSFIEELMNTGYMMPLVALTCLAGSILSFTKRTALAGVVLAPFTVNVILFHVFLDAVPVSAAAIPAYMLLGFNVWLLWDSRESYRALWLKK